MKITIPVSHPVLASTEHSIVFDSDDATFVGMHRPTHSIGPDRFGVDQTAFVGITELVLRFPMDKEPKWQHLPPGSTPAESNRITGPPWLPMDPTGSQPGCER